MKYLSHYVEAAQTELFKTTGAFFAFSQKQFDEGMKEGVEYVALGCGIICPKENVEALEAGLQSTRETGIAQDLAENGKQAIIARELHNYEAFYTGDISEACGALSGYGISRDEVRAEYNKIAPTIDY